MISTVRNIMHMDHFQAMALVRRTVAFFESHNTTVNVDTIAHFAIAFRELGTTEWNPGSETIQKVKIFPPNSLKDGYIMRIFGPGMELNDELTKELNEALMDVVESIDTTPLHIHY